MLSIKINFVIPLNDINLLVFFENGVIKKFDVKNLIHNYPQYKALEDINLFNSVKVDIGGCGVSWNEDLDCSEYQIWRDGIDIPLNIDDFNNFIKFYNVNIKDKEI